MSPLNTTYTLRTPLLGFYLPEG